MRIGGVLLALLLALPARGEEDPAPQKAIPACLKPGAAEAFVREAAANRLRETVRYTVEPGEEKGFARLVATSATAKLGPLTRAETVRAVLDLGTGLVVRADGEATEGDAPARRRGFDLRPDPEKGDRLVLTRYEYDAKGERKERTSRLSAPGGLWTPDRLEPFVAALLDAGPDRPAPIAVFDTERLRFSSSIPVYRVLGEGRRKVGAEDVACAILRREQGESKGLVYRRIGDGMPLRDEAAGLAIEPPEAKEPAGKKEVR